MQIRSLRNGASYRGGIVKGKKTGLGQFQWKNGDVFEGQFLNDTMSGYGVYTHAAGGLYQGQVGCHLAMLLLLAATEWVSPLGITMYHVLTAVRQERDP